MSALVNWYQDQIAQGLLSEDAHQFGVVQALQTVIDGFSGWAEAEDQGSDGIFSRLFSSERKRRAKPGVQGLYIYGGVGRGKTMLMDQAFDLIVTDYKTRYHFNDFMLGVHARLNEKRAASKSGRDKGDILRDVALDIAQEVDLLCFDEFQVRDIADAMILKGLFDILFKEGVTVIATSNVAPNDLYMNGLQRERFLPFVDVLKAYVQVMALDSERDYRLVDGNEAGEVAQEGPLDDLYFTPLNTVSKERMRSVFSQLRGANPLVPYKVEMSGRVWEVEESFDGGCWLSFAEVCEQPRAAEDYIALANAFPVIFLHGVPHIGYDRRNEAKRFILFIDVLYDKGCTLVMNADAEPDRLYRGHDHAFEFDRTISRLQEMRRKFLPL